MFNRLGLCISYDDLERVDIAITQEIICLTGPNRVQVPKNINLSSIIHGGMDNFDHEGNTLSEIGGKYIIRDWWKPWQYFSTVSKTWNEGYHRKSKHEIS